MKHPIIILAFLLPLITHAQNDPHLSSNTINKTSNGLPTEPAETANKANTSGSDYFAVFELPEQAVYVNQFVPLQIKFYFRDDDSVTLTDIPHTDLIRDDFQKFFRKQNWLNNRLWKDFKATPLGKPTQSKETINEVLYNVICYQTAFIPQTSGTIVIPAVSITGNIIHSDQPLEANGRSVDRKPAIKSFVATTQPLELEVLALPQNGQPNIFSGTIGQYTISAAVSPTSAEKGDSVLLALTVKGRGNFDGMEPPELSTDDGWRVYSPKLSFWDVSPDGHGTVTFEYRMIARKDQTQTPEARFCYFDPLKKKYVTLRSAPVPLHAKGAGESAELYKTLWIKTQQAEYPYEFEAYLDFCELLVGKRLHDSQELECDIGLENINQVTKSVLSVEERLKDEGLVATSSSQFTPNTYKHYNRSALIIGRMFMYGAPGVATDPEKAFNWFQTCNSKTSDTNNRSIKREAQFEIGLALINGRGTTKDVNAGLRWVTSAADKGYEPAIYFLRDYEGKNANTTTDDTQQSQTFAAYTEADLPHSEPATVGVDTAGDDSGLAPPDDPEMLTEPFAGWSDLTRVKEFAKLPREHQLEMFTWWAEYSQHYINNQIKVSPPANIPKLKVLLNKQNEWIAKRLESSDFISRKMQSPADIYYGSAFSLWTRLSIFYPFIGIIFAGLTVAVASLYFQKKHGLEIYEILGQLTKHNKWVVAIMAFALGLDIYGLTIQYLGIWAAIPSLALVSYSFGTALLVRFVFVRRAVPQGFAILLAIALYMGWFSIRLAITSEMYKPTILMYLCCFAFYRILRHTTDDSPNTPLQPA